MFWNTSQHKNILILSEKEIKKRIKQKENKGNKETNKANFIIMFSVDYFTSICKQKSFAEQYK